MESLHEWATERPLFTVNDVERATGGNRASLREKLSRMTKRGDLIRIERGTYTVHDDPLIYATYIETPSYLTFWSGLRYYDLTTQQPATVQVMAGISKQSLDHVRLYRSNDLFGFGKRAYRGFEIFVADPERLLIDCLSRPHVAVADLDELLDAVDPELAADYAERFGRRAVMKRVGFLLERRRDVSIERLRIRDRNYPVLDLSAPKRGENDAAWRLKVNTDALPA